MFQNLADSSCADRAQGTVGAARRRRNGRLRAFLKHERMTVAMNLATIQHHSYMKSAVVDVGVQVGSPLALVIEYLSSAPVFGYLAPAPAVQRHTVEPHALRADPRRSCAAEGGTAGGFLQGFGHREECPRSHKILSLSALWISFHRWWNSWWKCRPS